MRNSPAYFLSTPMAATSDHFNHLIARFHAGETPLLDELLTFLPQADGRLMQQYCLLLMMLTAVGEQRWETGLAAARFLYAHIPSAWDLPSIPLNYIGEYAGQETLEITPILDALHTLAGQYPDEIQIGGLRDRYREREASQ
jgi:hypothetical protein